MQETVNESYIDNKIAIATEGFTFPHHANRLKNLCSRENALSIAEFLLDCKVHGLGITAMQDSTFTLCKLSDNVKKSFNSFTREDNLSYLDHHRKTDAEDPTHKWVGTYNLRLVHIHKFFKWFGNTDCIQNIPQLKRKEVSKYSPSDLWTAEDNIVFPYVKDWLDNHPLKNNSNSHFICVTKKYIGHKMTEGNLYKMYEKYKSQFFPKLLENPDVPKEDKSTIAALLKKPFNPYIFRHSALTNMSKILKEHVLRQHAGWSINSQMPQRYLHYFGNESSISILEAYGIKQSAKAIDKLKPVQCPNCGNDNKIDSKFCSSCKLALTFQASLEADEENKQMESDLIEVKEQLTSMQTQFQAFVSTVAGIDQSNKNKFAKQLLANGTYKKSQSTEI